MDFDPQQMGLLSAAFRGLQASGPSRSPVSMGQVIGQAGEAGMAGYQQGLQSQRQGVLLAAQMQELKKKQAQEAYLQQYAASLPEKDRAAFLVDPASYIKTKNETPYGKINPSEYTPESLVDFNTTRDFSKLVRSVKMDPVETVDENGSPVTRYINAYNPPTSPIPKPVRKEMVSTGGTVTPVNTYTQTAPLLTTPTGFTRDPDGALKIEPGFLAGRSQIAAAGAPKVNVSQTTGRKYGDQLAGLVAKSDIDLRESAIKSPDLAERSNMVRQLLSSGKVITGTGADFRLAFGKAASLVGLKAADDPVANTETLATSLAQNTLDAIKASGLGSGNGFSNADRDFLEKAVGGKITLEKETLNKLSQLAHRAAEKTAERWNQRSSQIPRDAVQGTGIDISPIKVPKLFNTMMPNPTKNITPKFLGFEGEQ